MDDKEYAGASGEDIATAKALGIDGVVITKLPDKRFNFEFYTHKGVRIDLGDYGYSIPLMQPKRD